VKHTQTTAGTVYFCGCKHTGTPPLCDGTHRKL
jgi:CDGSH iron-sulfur domain-containing protein 3